MLAVVLSTSALAWAAGSAEASDPAVFGEARCAADRSTGVLPVTISNESSVAAGHVLAIEPIGGGDTLFKWIFVDSNATESLEVTAIPEGNYTASVLLGGALIHTSESLSFVCSAQVAGAALSPDGTPGPGCVGQCPRFGEQFFDGAQDVVLENVVISNPFGRCLSIRNARNVVIRNVTFENCGVLQPVTGGREQGLIDIVNSSNVTIEDSVIRNMSAPQFSQYRNNAVHVTDSPNTRIVNSVIRDVHSDITVGTGRDDFGNRSILVRGDATGLSITGNEFHNAGRNAVQLSRVRNRAGISITDNVIAGRGPWDSDYEDIINLYSSSGTPESPIRISRNLIVNGGPSRTGTAIIVGDGSSTDGPTQWVLVDDNVIVNPGHVGINLAGGDNIVVTDNIIYGDQPVRHPTTTGLTINHYGYSAECRDHVVTGNRVFMRNQLVASGTNHVWNTRTCANTAVYDNVWGDTSLAEEVADLSF